MTALSLPRGLTIAAASKLLSELIEIPSINPAYDDASEGENALGDAVGKLCESFGCTVEKAEVVDGRRNVIAHLRSRNSRKTLLIEAHLDTVGLPNRGDSARGRDMSVAAVEGNRVYGRGACDVKGALTAVLLAMKELAEDPLENLDLQLLGAVDEEYQFRGITHYISAQTQIGQLPDCAIVLEPTDLQVVNEHHGVVRVEIQVRGLAAHTSRPEEGQNAIVDALTVVDRLQGWNSESGGRILAVTTISGGSAINIIPDACTFGVDLRILPWEDPGAVLLELEAELDLMTREGVSARVSEQLLLDGGMATPADADLVQAALQGYGQEARPMRVTFGTDGSKLARAGVPTIVYGPGSIEQAHADDEWVDLREVVAASEHIIRTARAIDSFDGSQKTAEKGT